MIRVAEPVLNGREGEYVAECLANNWLTSGKFVSRFEFEFARYIGVKEAVACSSGTAALHLALLALGVQPGDEVIIPDLTFVATANAVRYCGATPVFADVQPDTWNIDPDQVRRLITRRTAGIIAVHLYGYPADLKGLQQIANERDLFVLEDAAEAHGAWYCNQRVGSLGKAGVFSFYGNKIITTGEGGMVTTNDSAMAERMRRLRGHCQVQRGEYWFDQVGYNYRLTDLQAAVGLAQLERIDWHIQRRREVALLYRQQLGENFEMQQNIGEEAGPVYWMNTVLVDDAMEMRRRLKAKGIETRPVFVPLHQLPPYRQEPEMVYANSERIAQHGINLPSHAGLSDNEVERVCDTLKAVVNA